MWTCAKQNFEIQYLCPKEELLEKNNRLVSPSTFANGREWWLQIESVDNRYGKDYVSVALYTNPSPVDVAVEFKFRLVAVSGGTTVESPLMSYSFFNTQSSHQRSYELELISTLKNNAARFCINDKFLVEASVVVKSLELFHRCPPIVTYSELTKTSDADENKTAANPSESAAAFDGPDKDVLIVSSDDKSFACHGYILASNDKFRKLLEGEAKTDGPPAAKRARGNPIRIVLPETSGDVVRVVLSHIYHGSIKFDVSIAGDVLRAAETYDLRLLTRECCAAVTAKPVTVENFVDHLLAGQLTTYSSTAVMDACGDFWPKHGAEVMKHEKWDRFVSYVLQKPKYRILIDKLISNLFKTLSEISSKQTTVSDTEVHT